MSKHAIDPEHLTAWLSSVPVDELEAIEDVFRNVGEGLPFERTSGELVGGFGNQVRWALRAFATIIRCHRESGAPLLDNFQCLSEIVDGIVTENEIAKLERLWKL